MDALRLWWVPRVAAVVVACVALAGVQLDARGAVAPKDVNGSAPSA